VTELTTAAAKARALQKNPPTAVNDDVATLIGFAAEVAHDLNELPVGRLEFAKSNGLRVHETVFWGQALTAAASIDASYGPCRSPELRALETEQRAKGYGGLSSYCL
jgi:hypothetical protein